MFKTKAVAESQGATRQALPETCWIKYAFDSELVFGS